MMTEDAIQELNDLKEGEFDTTNRGIKNALVKMKQDGLERTMGSDRYSDYLIPFKQLIEREFKKPII